MAKRNHVQPGLPLTKGAVSSAPRFPNAFLRAATKREAEKNIVAAVDKTAKMLGNTRSVCRKYYIHPVVIESFVQGQLVEALDFDSYWTMDHPVSGFDAWSSLTALAAVT